MPSFPPHITSIYMSIHSFVPMHHYENEYMAGIMRVLICPTCSILPTAVFRVYTPIFQAEIGVYRCAE